MSAVPESRARWAGLAAAAVALLAVTTVRAEESRPAEPVAAAWFPSGVGTVAAATYPADTLHVGAALGQETDRTYLRFDLGSLPDDADVSRVRITIPVNADAGTSSPETAMIVACAVPGGFDPEGTAPAEVDCDGAPEATFVAGSAPSFTISLPAPAGDAVDVALVPSGGDTWHVGFDGPEGDAPSTAVASYDTPPPATTTSVPAAARPTTAPTFSAPTPGPVALAPVTPPPEAAGSIVADEAAVSTPAAVTGVPAGGSTGFRYAGIFALPLALLVVLAVAGDGLTRPVRLRPEQPS